MYFIYIFEKVNTVIFYFFKKDQVFNFTQILYFKSTHIYSCKLESCSKKLFHLNRNVYVIPFEKKRSTETTFYHFAIDRYISDFRTSL